MIAHYKQVKNKQKKREKKYIDINSDVFAHGRTAQFGYPFRSSD